MLTRGITLLALGVLLACEDATAPPAPQPASLTAVTVIDQVGPVATAVNDPPVVRVAAADGAPLAGVRVSFAATRGGLVEPTSAVTDEKGEARVVAWEIPSGASELRASVDGLPAAVFRALGRPRTFRITLRWLAPPTDDARIAVEGAVAQLEQLIWEDLPDETLSAAPACNVGGAPAAVLTETVDDVLILARIGPMDGPGGGSAQGFPCLIRDPGTQTIVGIIRLDEADWPSVPADLRQPVALHELVHALGMVPGVLNITTPSGFTRACVQRPSTGGASPVVQDTHFACRNAVAMFDRVGGDRYAGLKVPLENGATRPLGANTLNHHWRKTSLTNELMTGWFIAGQPGPLSLVTAGALADLGYAVSYAAAEPFALPPIIASRVLPGGDLRLSEPPPPPPRLVGPGQLVGRVVR